MKAAGEFQRISYSSTPTWISAVILNEWRRCCCSTITTKQPQRSRSMSRRGESPISGPNLIPDLYFRQTIFTIRLQHLLVNVLSRPPWSEGFTIWNAGKAGKHFFKSLPESHRHLVKSFCDVDVNKVGKFYRHYDPQLRKEVSPPVPIISFRDAQPPLIVCMKLNLTQGQFEENLNSLNLVEGMDYILFP